MAHVRVKAVEEVKFKFEKNEKNKKNKKNKK